MSTAGFDTLRKMEDSYDMKMVDILKVIKMVNDLDKDYSYYYSGTTGLIMIEDKVLQSSGVYNHGLWNLVLKVIPGFLGIKSFTVYCEDYKSIIDNLYAEYEKTKVQENTLICSY